MVRPWGDASSRSRARAQRSAECHTKPTLNLLRCRRHEPNSPTVRYRRLRIGGRADCSCVSGHYRSVGVILDWSLEGPDGSPSSRHARDPASLPDRRRNHRTVLDRRPVASAAGPGRVPQTIYLTRFVRAGGALQRGLATHLRTRRIKRRSRARTSRAGTDGADRGRGRDR
jgi:hypothetical protein